MHLRNSILATLIYYDILDFPPTLFEVYKYLVNPARINKVSVDLISISQIEEGLENLLKTGLVGSKNGFYFLNGREDICGLRIEREKIAAGKWRRLLKIANRFQAVPYLRSILASGSMAVNNTDNESDFDVLVIARSGRLYICRIFLSLVASLFRARRKRYDAVAPDKFCFNHYITDANLNIKHESLFNAQTYVNLKPVLIDQKVLNDFYASNVWLNKYVYSFRPPGEFVGRSVATNHILRVAARLGEIILNTRLGDWIEKKARNYQQKRIKNNPATYEAGGRVVFNDTELEFHPRSFEAVVIKKYNQGLRKLGIIPFIEEKDSGLLS